MNAGCGRVLEVRTGVACGPADWPPAGARRKGVVVNGHSGAQVDVEATAVSAALQARWRDVYGYYLDAVETRTADPRHGAVKARRSLDVAGVYRVMAETPNLATWLLLAVVSAEEAFERQAEDWGAALPDEDMSAGTASGSGEGEPT